MPWIPELFSARVLERIQSRDARAAGLVPYFAGVISGETDALVQSFAGEPEVHHPIRGRVKGHRAFEQFVADTNAWLLAGNATIGDVTRTITPRRGIEETLVSLDGVRTRVELPIAVVADRDDDARIIELRIYHSTWPLTGRHAARPPLLQPDPNLREPDVVGEYRRALAAGDVRAVVQAFEPDAYVREPAGGAYVHRGHDELVALYEVIFSNGGGIRLERCALTDDGHSCALEYNVVGWGRTDLQPAAGLAVHVRGTTGRLAAARIYEDVDPPIAR
jgi:hypothetical protein